MLSKEVLRVAMQALRNHRLRSALTMLGIIIGVAAMITMVALGQGAQKSVQGRIESLGPDLLTAYPGQTFRGHVASEQRVSLTVEMPTRSRATYATSAPSSPAPRATPGEERQPEHQRERRRDHTQLRRRAPLQDQRGTNVQRGR
jgi:putative ABC transport system permease protein